MLLYHGFHHIRPINARTPNATLLPAKLYMGQFPSSSAIRPFSYTPHLIHSSTIPQSTL